MRKWEDAGHTSNNNNKIKIEEIEEIKGASSSKDAMLFGSVG